MRAQPLLPPVAPLPPVVAPDSDAAARTALIVNTAGFALSFAAWVALGPSARLLASELHLSAATVGFVKALPILVGAVMRIPVGLLADRLGARLVFPTMMLAAAVGACVVATAHGLPSLLCGAVLLGMSGSTFVVGVQSVSSWTPASRQGRALGTFGAGNAGTAITSFGMPFVLLAIGWRHSFWIYAAILVVAASLYWSWVRDAKRTAPRASLTAMLAPLGAARTWRFGLYYTATFGIFVATTLTVSDMYIESYGLGQRTAGMLATTFTLTSSLSRIYGGRLADRHGARRVLRASLLVILCLLPWVALQPPLAVTVALIFGAGLAMGIGMAATIRYVPDYFPRSVGVVSGLVGALGGIGGFVLPLAGGLMRSAGLSIGTATLPIAGVAVVALVVQFLAVRAQERAVPAKLHVIAKR